MKDQSYDINKNMVTSNCDSFAILINALNVTF